ncbi:thioesterase II family protein [Streptomyces spongiae]|uniref:Thioesterase n=1 Tax=Streptomyces spongiae TaxID=565072 RepID=A0A5N8XSF1_9ACTN|nr:alpha/beta fold hydrolase [Streptomyces spongiae]MPY62333.1 thioesterase [Streptomyces spongiae]
MEEQAIKEMESKLSKTPWFRRFGQSVNPAVKLICFPHMGGSASSFRTWPGTLPPDVEVLAVRYPGREDRSTEQWPPNMQETVRSLTDAILASAGEPRTVLFGHSMGALLAYEVAQALEQHGRPPHMLMTSGREAPHHTKKRDLDISNEGEVIKLLDRLGMGGVALADPYMRNMILRVIKADYELMRSGNPSHLPVTCPIRAYVGDMDPLVTHTDMRAWSELCPPEKFSWRSFSGDHFYLRQPDMERQLLHDIAEWIR